MHILLQSRCCFLVFYGSYFVDIEEVVLLLNYAIESEEVVLLLSYAIESVQALLLFVTRKPRDPV